MSNKGPTYLGDGTESQHSTQTTSGVSIANIADQIYPCLPIWNKLWDTIAEHDVTVAPLCVHTHTTFIVLFHTQLTMQQLYLARYCSVKLRQRLC